MLNPVQEAQLLELLEQPFRPNLGVQQPPPVKAKKGNPKTPTIPDQFPVMQFRPGEPLPKTITKKNRNPKGMARLKKRKVRLRMARRTRILVSVQVVLIGFDDAIGPSNP